jgi:hypothetical protein
MPSSVSSAPNLDLNNTDINSHSAAVRAAARLAGFSDSNIEPSRSIPRTLQADPDDYLSPELVSTPHASSDGVADDGMERSKELWAGALPAAQGLYDPEGEKDACGVGFICHIKGCVLSHVCPWPRNVSGIPECADEPVDMQ